MTEILPPEDPKPNRRRRADPDTPADTTVDAVEKTIADYERAAIETGEWNGTDAPEFSDDGETWTTAWGPTVDRQPPGDDTEPWTHPTFARATVRRKGIKRPVVVVIRWDEALPADEHWRALWMRKPIALFGAFALRAAYRRAFRDVIGDHHAPDENHDTDPEVTE